ncbi:GtrA family protein [Tianweitania sp. BSSL-BM11]|uniref:GtrA family protein n=1 Tax=Tianweitania aestuarii TaxID=2814886 RepID=A0ABS5RXD0_9HYPH|nr:GtrA family protein [Tianweitania aestuarii]MBS9721710.1 GtrA family protein [Tianweitania aestuarii]
MLSAALATFALLVLYASSGFSTLHEGRGDNDSMLRLVEVRDLLGGQGWFNLNQTRMGLAGGFVMHWSRLIDAPIAGVIWLAGALGAAPERAQHIAAVVWPLLLFFAALNAILVIARRLAGEAALLPAAVIATTSLYYVGIFAPGALDHHNAQLTLTLAMLAGLVTSRGRFWPAAGAGACAALMLAIGMETAPYVAVGGLCAALAFWWRGGEESPTAIGFGLGFAVVAGAVFVATVPRSSWMQPACDAYSFVQWAVATLAGFGLAGLAAVKPLTRTRTGRTIGLALLGAAVASLLVFVYPQCLADPYAMVDPWLKANWLAGVSEAQSAWDLVHDKPAELATYYAYPLLGIGVLLVRLWRRPRRADLFVLATLLAAYVVTLWQVRGSLFLLPLTAIPLAAWIAEARRRASERPSRRHLLAMAVSWIGSFIVSWIALSIGINAGLAAMAGKPAEAMMPDNSAACYNKPDYAGLAQEPTGRVLAPTNLGSAILLYTGHSALAGPYHRNHDGNRLALQALMAAPEAARSMLQGSGVTLVVWCPGNPESASLVARAPNSLAAELARKAAPAWLQPTKADNGNLDVYRVLP